MKKYWRIVASLAFFQLMHTASADTLKPLDSDREPDRIEWSQLGAKLGPVPKPKAGTRIGAVAKTMTNEYWRLLGEGYKAGGSKNGVQVDVQAAQSEGDQLGQLAIAENRCDSKPICKVVRN